MASTGVSWMPLFEVLEARGFQAVLIDPRQAQRAPGRPTSDPYDCQWLQRLHPYGLLAGAFRQDAEAPPRHLEVVKLPEAKKGFVLLPRRWVVERSFAWAGRFRHLVRDYEQLAETLAVLHCVAFAILMLKRFVALMV